MKLCKHVYIPVGSMDRKDFVIGIFHSVSWPKYKEHQHKCGNSGTKKLPFEDKLKMHESNSPLSWPVSDEDKKDLRAALTEVSLGNHGNGS